MGNKRNKIENSLKERKEELPPGHSREKVVLELVLHSSPKPLRERIGANSIPRMLVKNIAKTQDEKPSGTELSLNELRVLVKEEFLRLMSDSGDDGCHKSAITVRFLGVPNIDHTPRQEESSYKGASWDPVKP